MQKAIAVTKGLRMPACNDFVEHIWKPGFCKNCFHPKSDHRKHQAPSDGKVGNLPVLPSLNGIRIKQENTNQDDDIVIAALYSKPTIAVKPTMITSETAEEWAELNHTETLTQVSWKSGDISGNILDKITKPFTPNFTSSNEIPTYIFNGLSTHDKKTEINAVQNLTYVSHFGGQVDKAVFLKEKVSEPAEQCSLFSKQNKDGDIKKPNYFQAEPAVLSSKIRSVYNSGTQSVADRLSPNGSLHSKDKTDPRLCNQTRSANDSKPCHNSEQASSKSMFFSRMKVSLHSESHNLSCVGIKDSPLASPTIADSQTEFQSSVSPVDGRDNEPIYAESTKRKGFASKGTKTVMQTEKVHSKQEENGTIENQCSVGIERVLQESTTHVAARITVMAAHTEEDNRTIYLSSPDSAVGVEWSCSSPSSVENLSLSPTFLWGERNHGKGIDGNKKYQASLSQKFQSSSSLVVPAKTTKFEDFSTSKLSSPMHTIGMLSSIPHKKEPLVLNDRCLTGDRRQRITQAAWNRQCRIDEEEEEETSPVSSQPRPSGQPHASSYIAEERDTMDVPRGQKGMSKSVSCPVELSKASNGVEDSSAPPPPPPPKKQPRQFKMNKSSCELENISLGSVESLGESFKATNVSNSNVNINVSFSTGSMDSLDSRTCSEGGQSCEAVTSPSLSSGTEKKHFAQVSFSVDSGMEAQNGLPPPLPVKKSMNRAVSAPDNSAWGRAFPPRTGSNPNSPRLNLSQSENNVCGEEPTLLSHPLSPVDRHAMFSSSESLEICCRGNGHRNEVRSRNCLQSRGTPAMSVSQLSVSSHISSASSLQLHHLLSNIDSKEGMYAKLSGLYAQSTRRLMNKCEDYFMRDQKKELHFNENNWSLFKLTSNKPCCNAGDAIYYCATCAKDPVNNYAVKLCRTVDTKTPIYSNLSLPVHFNIQQDCGHFLASVPSSLLHPLETSTNEISQTVGPSSEEDCVVVITREVPYRTAADFVKESSSFHNTQPEIYERQVCLLLLQLCNGLEHLKEHAIIHRDLCLENLLLVHFQTTPDKIKDGKYVPRLIVSNFSKAKQRPGSEDCKVKRDKTRLAPEIMVASQYKKFDEFQTGILIYELLHQQNPFEARSSLHEHEYSHKDLPPLQNLSVYSRGLQHLAHLLLEADPIKRIRISEAKRILQCLLWGPRKDLTDQPFSHEEALHCALQNWIDMKRALLMMKFAERALEPEHNVSLEDWLCCQYLASADPCYLYKTLKLIKLIT
ncbi:inactive tyrosine-protein kinase PRAG1-like [Hyla sarda]|uniref:inactive tyrosine-protein kinase PRAG1-like n=1 Tax=Hyla sarda TaxID=327740 RepID=UPI0024C30398|nr:inactive tyrosine-protein kinase PRAG1-like [Hyla sarda]XP_056424851.1 inactive tyrosine-protein kinase PRAG1-like [Hyla sarda]XP_056424852.1 inactive tyrosine-protein kinase PRAG1-like [Hyla sarda]